MKQNYPPQVCPFCNQSVEVRSEVPDSDPYFSIHSDETGQSMCEGACLSIDAAEFLAKVGAAR